MAQDHSNFSMGIRFGRENSAGGGGYANRVAENLTIDMDPRWTTKDYRGKGRRYRSSYVQGDERTEGTAGGPLGFADILIPMLSHVKNVSPVAGASSSQVWTIIPNPRGGDAIQTFVVEETDEDLTLQRKHLLWTSFGIHANRDEATHTGNVLAQETNVIPNFSGLAGPLAPAWVAATAYPLGAVVKRATGVEVFQFRATAIAGSGTSGATEPTWPGTLAGTVVDNPGANQITWSAIEATSEMENVLVVSNDTDIFYNLTSMAGLDSSPTQLLRSFDYNFSVGGGHMPFAPINSGINSFLGVTENEVDATLALDVGIGPDVAKTDLLDPFSFDLVRRNRKVWVRWQALGPLIGGAVYYLIQIDACCQIRDSFDFKDVQGLFGNGVPLGIVNDPTVGYPWKAKIVNKTLANLLAA